MVPKPQAPHLSPAARYVGYTEKFCCGGGSTLVSEPWEHAPASLTLPPWGLIGTTACPNISPQSTPGTTNSTRERSESRIGDVTVSLPKWLSIRWELGS